MLLKSATGKQWASGFTVGIIANFLDTLGCGSYAPSTFMYKLFNQIDDIDIPGTLNVGDTFPVIFEAFIFTASVDCDPCLPHHHVCMCCYQIFRIRNNRYKMAT